jgi:hypothetical protein
MSACETSAASLHLTVFLLLTAHAGLSGAATRIDVSGSTIEVVRENRLAQGDSDHWREWIDVASSSLVTVIGKFPEDRVRVRLTASGARYPITFGSVRRSRPPEVRMQVHPRARLDSLLDDWRGFHEFAHLLLPFAGNKDIWFAEGLAAYYQHLLQVRAGVITPEEGWRRLFAGFQRGLDDPSGRGMTLAELSPLMWRERAFRRIHWTGASFFLQVDLKLRQASGGEHSLDSTLAAFARCCRDLDTPWNARQLVEQLGELSLPEVWRETHDRMIDAEAVPDLAWSMERLGIEWHGGEIRLSDNPLSTLRRTALALGHSDPPGNGDQARAE